ncbi:MAG: hypothetical protein D6731_04600 [Planctomycetota bacterium]|nr:MAG: hypothetical protein D6731_04600 [Planctomycetota bacterium]
MPCKACGADDALEVCLFCGHPHCARHRDVGRDPPVCTDCLRAEAERRRARRPLPAPAVQGAEAAAPSEPPALPSLREPRGLRPLPWGVVAGILGGGYVHWMFARIAESPDGFVLPGAVRTALSVGAGGLVCFAVWAILKTRAAGSRRRGSAGAGGSQAEGALRR